MKLFGRRKTMAGIAVAPATAGGMMSTTMKDVQYKEQYLSGMLPPGLPAIAEPENLKSYYSAVGEAHKGWNFFEARRDLQRYHDSAISPNIACLKSVATQHKYIMHMREVDRYYEERRSVLEKLLDTFGVRDYFKKIEGRNGGSQAAAVSRY